MQQLHLIEPTLADQTGHGYSYNYSLIQANAKQPLFSVNLWLDRRAKDLFKNLPGKFHLFFSQKLRQLQKISLYRKLLQQPDIIYICTAGTIDLVILNTLYSSRKTKAQVFLHFHQFNSNPKKLNLLKKAALKNPNFNIFAPTQALLDIFIQQGFKNCQLVPCPTFPRENNNSTTETYANEHLATKAPQFKKVLYAGAARKDKGFPTVVSFVQHLRKSGNYLPFEIQVSPPHSQRYDQESTIALQSLLALPEEGLTIHQHTLDRISYQNLFPNAICCLIYDQPSYHNKFSGVALDAFYAGCPIITAKDTWMGDMAERFNCGVALSKYSTEQLLNAINLIKNNYPRFSQNASSAAQVLGKEHDPVNTLLAIKCALPPAGDIANMLPSETAMDQSESSKTSGKIVEAITTN